MRRLFSLASPLRRIMAVRSSDVRRSTVRCLGGPPATTIDASERRRRGPLAMYRGMVEEGKLRHDVFQEKAAVELEDLVERLERYEKDMEEYHVKLANWEKRREEERRGILLKEADMKQRSGEASGVNSRRGFIEKIMRRRQEKVEPGVGKMASYLNREKKLISLVGRRPIAPPAPRGLYLYGNVGSGKTMLMDMFFTATEGVVRHRRRFHFNEAMLVINERMHEIWKSQVEEQSLESGIFSWISKLPFNAKIKEWLTEEEIYKKQVQMKHILPAVADKFLYDWQADQKGASILCFDEIQTVDVFAIVALSGILSRLLSTGTVLVATSNRAPEDLNQDGMQKDIFLKLLAKLEDSCQNILVGSEIDYRRLIPRRTVDQVHYFWPLDNQSRKEFEIAWQEVTNQYGGNIISTTISVMFGRTLDVLESCNGVARFHFDYLCGRPVGAADYIAVAKNYHTVFISDIPVMSMRIGDKARRFITLIDELYNHHCCLVCTAASSMDDLFKGTDEGPLFDLESFQFETEMEDTKLRKDVFAVGSVSSVGAPAGIASLLSGREEMFAFRRAVSRLIEMQTPLYLEGVRVLHPYFQRQKGDLETAHQSPAKLQASSSQASF